ncbi:Crp/Fnr family transcriptional regulator [Cryptosporangium phraense]|uniref:CRP-like cAMP-activated global transcriptional regulator n=1 Tax=Cryptosporangium phraense TaxID=2593070 RepID=A0A545AVB3_9ACTN|nr:Crp/Fnr family transcriptional regulator [Cryptosporangium phraense]TQS45282.1 Crp/Fnr family transcriptional regulator [Cryptosporangium phraense]
MEETLARSGLFQNVEPAAAEALASHLKYLDVFRRDVVFSEGDAGESLYIVLEGKIKLLRRSPDGREGVLALMGPSDLLGELAVFDPGPRTATAVVVSDARLAQMHRDQLRPWIAEHPAVGRQLLQVLARRLRRTGDHQADLIFTDVSGRLAKTLLELARRFGVPERDSVRVYHDLTQDELAQLVGASRETVNKSLSDFATRGWIRLESKQVVILNRERLVQRAH